MWQVREYTQAVLGAVENHVVPRAGVGKALSPLSLHRSVLLCVSVFLCVSLPLCLSVSVSLSIPCLWLCVSTILFFLFPTQHFSMVLSVSLCASDFLSLFLHVSLCFRLSPVSLFLCAWLLSLSSFSVSDFLAYPSL